MVVSLRCMALPIRALSTMMKTDTYIRKFLGFEKKIGSKYDTKNDGARQLTIRPSENLGHSNRFDPPI